MFYLSVVIPAFNEEKRLPQSLVTVLGFLKKQPYDSEIIVSDDGEGIDTEQVRAAAIKSGLTAKDVAGKLSDLEVLPFIFRSRPAFF